MTGKQSQADRPDIPASVQAALARQRIMAIVRSGDAGQAAALAERLIGAGLQVVEVSMQTPRALQIVKELVGRHGGTAHLGVGTVLDEATAARAAQAGAQFIVAPTLNADVIQAARRNGMASFPGCATPTEMQRALELGATAVKLFPASLWTPRAMADVLHAMPHLSCVPTGGVRLDEITKWLTAGATAVGLGSSLEQRMEAVLAQVRQVPANG